MIYAKAMIAEIVPEKRTNPDKDTFSYLVPEKLQGQIKVGSVVEISFGKKDIRGVVMALCRHPELDSGSHNSSADTMAGFQIKSEMTERKVDYELKEIKAVNHEFTISDEYLEVAKWISKYYLCSFGEAISLFLPPKLLRPQKFESRINNYESSKKIELTSEQEKIFLQLKNNLSAPKKKPALIFGVTGSGKTEIYIKLAAESINRSKQVVVLVPEIMLTPQIVDKFQQQFPNQICLMHSNLSKSERHWAYKEFYAGKKKIIIGPRSALLVPSTNIGLIIIDEEQEDAYKQEKDPRYHAVRLAEEIAKKTNSLLVLGTATPRIETFHKAKKGLFDLFELKSRYQKLILPPGKIVDLKSEIKHDNFSPISLELQKNILDVLKKKRQVILFLNRRGMATFVSCRDCGEVINCPNCSIPMVYHINQNNHILNCHHCGYKTAVPTICPVCKSSKIKFFGAGVDKIEKEINKLFPNARIRKIDATALSNKNEYMKLYDDLKNRKVDILIGTQILAKGLDIETVDLVGVISADTGLHMPQFRASEKTFSLITQVSGRSGRKNNAGKTIIQTYWPDASAIKYAAEHDYTGFYRNEITEREKLGYPPFSHLVRVVSENKSQSKAKTELNGIAAKLKEYGINFIGPGPCFLNRINNKYRYHLLIKTNTSIDQKITAIFKSNPYVVWDVDPTDLL